VGEVDDVQDAEQQAEADGDQGVDRAERDPVEHLLQNLLGHPGPLVSTCIIAAVLAVHQLGRRQES
jgi:hypothetical protein